MAGIPFITAALTMTLAVAFTITLLELGIREGLWWHTFRRWGKFLLLLVILGVLIQGLTVLQG